MKTEFGRRVKHFRVLLTLSTNPISTTIMLSTFSLCIFWFCGGSMSLVSAFISPSNRNDCSARVLTICSLFYSSLKSCTPLGQSFRLTFWASSSTATEVNQPRDHFLCGSHGGSSSCFPPELQKSRELLHHEPTERVYSLGCCYFMFQCTSSNHSRWCLTVRGLLGSVLRSIRFPSDPVLPKL
jgi:hypothetical protein